ncbi:MAG: class I SAM-dependent methyltransferase [Rickettsiales bacterium]|nr:class I SAM-dependent methyltransferase [Rickettsiales bacterium]
MPNISTASQEVNPTKKPYNDGKLETVKFAHRREDYYAGVERMLEMGYKQTDFLYYFPAFVGQMTLWKALTLYEFYKKVEGICGHIAEVGVHMGPSSIQFAKMVQIFEPEALTMVHGFDWFRGTKATKEDVLINDALDAESEERLNELVRIQKLDHILKIHNLNVATEIDGFFEQHSHLRFKLAYLDSGTYPVVSAAIKAFWPRMVPGGIMIFDQYNNEVAPGETRAVTELLPDIKIQTIPNSWFPNAYVQKPFKA